MSYFHYNIFGINFESAIEIPEITQCEFNKPDVNISFGIIPKHLNTIQDKGVLYESCSDDFIFRIDSVGAYRVQNGRNITIQPAENANSDDIQLFLLGSTMGALLHQRNVLPLHGSAVLTKAGAFVISGKSAVGKSTLAECLHKRGYQIITDDISAITKNNDGQFSIYPGIPYIKLWQDVLSYFKYEMPLKRVRPLIKKFKRPVEIPSSKIPIPLRHILIVKSSNTLDFTIEHIMGGEKLEILIQNTYRYHYLIGLGKINTHFNTITELANILEISRIIRPNSPILVDKLADLIEERIINSL